MGKRTRALFAAFAVAATFVAATSVATAGAAELAGTITDREGRPLAGANVTVTGGALRQPVGAVSGALGDYAVRDLPPGTYDARISHIGFRAELRQGLRVDAGGARLDVELQTAVIDLEQRVVSASRTQEKALDAPASISVVDGEGIDDKAALSVSEFVRDQPGVDFAKTGLVQSNVVARGFNNIFSGALLTLTDNRMAAVPSLRLNAYNFIPLTNDDVERIEVVLGPGSALYGPNSANGVIHVITRSPFASAGTSVALGVGERSLRKGQVRHAGIINPHVAYKISAQYYTGTDWEYTDPAEADARAAALAAGAAADTLRVGGRDFDIARQSLEARVDIRPRQDLTAVVTYGYNQGDFVEMTGLGAGQVRDWTYNYLQARLVYQDWFTQFYHNWSDAGKTFLLRSGNDIIDESTLDVFQVQHSARLGSRQRFTYGFDALWTRPQTHGTITGNNEGDDDIDEYGLYLQSETDLTDRLELVLAARYDDHNRLEDAEVSPRAGLLYKPRETQTLRATYNRAFSTPTTNNLYLDLVSRRDPFGLGAFQASLGFAPAIDVRAQGTYRTGFDDGFTFRRAADGRAEFRTPFQPAIAAQLSALGLGPGSPGYPIDADGYIALDDPIAANVMWNIGRGAVLARFAPAIQSLAPGLIAQQLIAAGMGAQEAQAAGQTQAAAVVAALPSLVPRQLAGLTHATARLNLETAGFDPVAGAVDVPRTHSTITQTLELGYKGIVGGNLVLAADLYRSDVEDFVGPLAVETPNVFLNPATLAAALTPAFEAALADPANAQVAPVLAALDRVAIPGVVTGDNSGGAADELTRIFATGAARIPFGTLSPEQAYDPTAVLLTYRNFGDVTLYGFDLSAGFYPNDAWQLVGSYSFVSDDFFPKLGGISDVALNAPRHKGKVSGSYRVPGWRTRFGARLRYSGAFPMSSGVYVGDVDAYTAVDLSARYDLPFGEGLYLLANLDNVLGAEYRSFVGAPEVGRLSYLQLGLDF